MGNRLGQPNLLPHALAVTGNLSPCCITKPYSFDRLAGKIHGHGLFHPVKHQAVQYELPSGKPPRKEIELRAIPDNAEQFRLVSRCESKN
jgi:hypothetical protein